MEKKKKRVEHTYSVEEIQWLKDNYHDLTNEELMLLFNKKFNTTVSKNAIARQKTKYRLISNLKGGFKAGDIPWNKGIKGYDNGYQFKKGNIPPQTKNIGDERMNNKGFVEIKVQNPDKWKLKHHIVFEKEHCKKIKRNEKVIFLDRNRLNFDIENLYLVSSQELMFLTINNLLNKDPEITKVGTNIAKVKSKLNKIIKEKLK